MRYFLFLLWMFVYFHLIVSKDVSICAVEPLAGFSTEFDIRSSSEKLEKSVPVSIQSFSTPADYHSPDLDPSENESDKQILSPYNYYSQYILNMHNRASHFGGEL